VRIPIKAAAREPITQAGYISVTSAIHAHLTCDLRNPVQRGQRFHGKGDSNPVKADSR